jgi:hypothetical protein
MRPVVRGAAQRLGFTLAVVGLGGCPAPEEAVAMPETIEGETETGTGTGTGTDSDDTAGSCPDGCGGAAACGDGVVQDGEACDFGPDNADDGACTSACELAVCGDGLVYPQREECDAGGPTLDCTATCERCDETKMLGDGPISSTAHAQTACPQVCDGYGGTWTGHWNTTIPGELSLCECMGVCPDAA